MQRYVKMQQAAPLANTRAGSPGCEGRFSGQRGAYGVEFAAVFLAFFLIFYGILSWGMIIAARQSLQMAAEEGARRSLRYQAAGTDVLPQIRARLAAACTLADTSSNWISSLSGQATQCKATVAGTGLCAATGSCCLKFDRNVPAGALTGSGCQVPTSGWMVTLQVGYENYVSHPLVPVFPGLRAALPARLGAQAAVWIPPTSLDRGV